MKPITTSPCAGFLQRLGFVLRVLAAWIILTA